MRCLFDNYAKAKLCISSKLNDPKCLQMDDEASLLPRKLQAALEQALEQRNDIINQDSDSESDEGEDVTNQTDVFPLSWE